ncbi:hypothetical protein U9M48_035385 [Paspalum notatum var. saurae]|uniref:Response regulatory domain-containing protein n=1 Tax=Paspalum notatum var. saurae TaxID=547442 RepID=A0AAQ3X7M0_PASNO
MSERQEPQDIEGEGPAPSEAVNGSNARALVFQEASSYILKGVHHGGLYIHGFEIMRIKKTWMKSIGAKLIAWTENVKNNGTTAIAAGSSSSSYALDGDRGDQCISSKDMVSLVLWMALRNNNGPKRGSLGGTPSGILVAIDVSSCGGLDEIYQEMVKLVRIKRQQAPCKETAALIEIACVAKDQKCEDDKSLAGLQILLAEDTFVLQRIQKKMLNQLGATIKVTQDGVVAVNLFKEALEQASAPREGTTVPLPYDVVSIDC